MVASAVMRPDLFEQRGSGVLMPLTSVTGAFGTGDLGPGAHDFAQFLSRSGQSWWQMLPIGPTGAGNSPYDSPSSFAAGPHLISLERLAADGLLDASALRAPRALSGARARYAEAARFRGPRVRSAFERFERTARNRRALDRFVERQGEWLNDYVLFCALRRAHRGAAWVEWEPALRSRRRAALARARGEHEVECRFHAFVQYELDRQWAGLRARCREHGVRLLGDVPMFVAHDSADVWAHPELFVLDRSGRRRAVAGVPPDAFSRTGQLWGNPLYRWDRLRRTDFAWWIARLRRGLARFDALRLDHFIGMYRCYQVSARARTAERGRFVRVPGAELLDRLRDELGGLPFVAEDLGLLIDPVHALRDQFELPGMRVLQFGFDDEGGRFHQPHRYPRRCVAYTGTHDNDTVAGWLTGPGARAPAAARRAASARRRRALAYAQSDGRQPHWDLIRTVLMSPANTTIFPLQDLLGLDSEARMNVPGTARGNWEWRLLPRQLTPGVAQRMAQLCQTYERG